MQAADDVQYSSDSHSLRIDSKQKHLVLPVDEQGPNKKRGNIVSALYSQFDPQVTSVMLNQEPRIVSQKLEET